MSWLELETGAISLRIGILHPQGMPTAAAESLNQPKLAVVRRAIYRRQGLEVTYVSLISGRTYRKIVPHALVDNGQCWHIRAYDPAKACLSDFVITRLLTAAAPKVGAIGDHESPDADEQWNRIVELKRTPRPKIAHKNSLAGD